MLPDVLPRKQSVARGAVCPARRDRAFRDIWDIRVWWVPAPHPTAFKVALAHAAATSCARCADQIVATLQQKHKGNPVYILASTEANTVCDIALLCVRLRHAGPHLDCVRLHPCALCLARLASTERPNALCKSLAYDSTTSWYVPALASAPRFAADASCHTLGTTGAPRSAQGRAVPVKPPGRL